MCHLAFRKLSFKIISMITFLRKLFIHNYQDVHNEEVRANHGILASSIGIITNAILVAIKIGMALFLASETGWKVFPMALLVDAMNNLSDMASCIIVILGFKISSNPADEKHPFGHERAEYVAGLVVSFLILLIAFETIRESITKIIEGQTTSYDVLTIVLLVVSMLIKGFQGYCYFALGKAIDSKTLKTNAIDSISDILATGGVLIGAILSWTLGWDFLDPYLGLAIAILIAIAGIRMMFDNIDPILGGKQDPSLVKDIEERAKKHPGVLGIHDLIIHSYGPTKKFISFHLEVKDTTSLIDAHTLADKIENELSEKENAEVLIHVDPIATDDKESQELEEEIRQCVSSIHPEIKLHDFHLIPCTKEKKLSFDLSIPFCLASKEKWIKEQIQKRIRKKGTEYRLIIHFDHPF